MVSVQLVAEDGPEVVLQLSLPLLDLVLVEQRVRLLREPRQLLLDGRGGRRGRRGRRGSRGSRHLLSASVSSRGSPALLPLGRRSLLVWLPRRQRRVHVALGVGGAATVGMLVHSDAWLQVKQHTVEKFDASKLNVTTTNHLKKKNWILYRFGILQFCCSRRGPPDGGLGSHPPGPGPEGLRGPVHPQGHVEVPEVVVPPADGPVEVAVGDVHGVEQRVEGVRQRPLHPGHPDGHRGEREEALPRGRLQRLRRPVAVDNLVEGLGRAVRRGRGGGGPGGGRVAVAEQGCQLEVGEGREGAYNAEKASRGAHSVSGIPLCVPSPHRRRDRPDWGMAGPRTRNPESSPELRWGKNRRERGVGRGMLICLLSNQYWYH